VTLEVLELARDLAARGERYVLATVVWRRAPSSGKEGSKAVIGADGTVRGWLGGACAEPAVIREALRALDDGKPRLMFLGPPEELAGRSREGMVAVPIACQSEGALEVFVEPVIPAPHLVVIGRSPAVDALATMARALGWDAVILDDGAEPGAHASPANVISSLDMDAAGIGPRSFVVVATQGHYDEDALALALRTPAAYVGLVASDRRAESVIGYLRDRGVAEEDLGRVHAPAGLDLGRVSHQEIAVAILAELVRDRAAAAPPPAGEQLAPHQAVDPVCGMTVPVASARYRATLGGQTHYFCSAACLASFEAAPSRYVTVPS
jgi:xanthine dehydrogenase accessory factor